MDERFRDFCINEEARVRRFSEKLQQGGHWHKGLLLLEIAERFKKLSGDASARESAA